MAEAIEHNTTLQSFTLNESFTQMDNETGTHGRRACSDSGCSCCPMHAETSRMTLFAPGIHTSVLRCPVFDIRNVFSSRLKECGLMWKIAKYEIDVEVMLYRARLEGLLREDDLTIVWD